MSGTPQILAPAVIPELRDVLFAMRKEIFFSLNCATVGTIQSFNATRQTAEIKIAFQRVVGNGLVEYPLLVDCPVVVLAGGSGRLTFPIAAGDSCLVLFADRNIDSWFGTGAAVAPATERAHSLADGIALVGIRSLANAIGDYSTTAAQFKNNGAQLSLDTNLADLTSGAGAEVSLDSKVGILNGSGSLKSALDSLMTALTGWVDTHGDTPNPETATALTAAKVAIDALLK